MKEELRTKRPIGVCKYTKLVGHEDPTAKKAELDWSRFTYDEKRRLYILNPDLGFNPGRDSIWVYTKEFIDEWVCEMENTVLVMRDHAKSHLGFLDKNGEFGENNYNFNQ